MPVDTRALWHGPELATLARSFFLSRRFHEVRSGCAVAATSDDLREIPLSIENDFGRECLVTADFERVKAFLIGQIDLAPNVSFDPRQSDHILLERRPLDSTEILPLIGEQVVEARRMVPSSLLDSQDEIVEKVSRACAAREVVWEANPATFMDIYRHEIELLDKQGGMIDPKGDGSPDSRTRTLVLMHAVFEILDAHRTSPLSDDQIRIIGDAYTRRYQEGISDVDIYELRAYWALLFAVERSYHSKDVSGELRDAIEHTLDGAGAEKMIWYLVDGIRAGMFSSREYQPEVISKSTSFLLANRFTIRQRITLFDRLIDSTPNVRQLLEKDSEVRDLVQRLKFESQA